MQSSGSVCVPETWLKITIRFELKFVYSFVVVTTCVDSHY